MLFAPSFIPPPVFIVVLSLSEFTIFHCSKPHIILSLEVTVCFMLYTSLYVNVFPVILVVRSSFSSGFLKKSSSEHFLGSCMLITVCTLYLFLCESPFCWITIFSSLFLLVHFEYWIYYSIFFSHKTLLLKIKR